MAHGISLALGPDTGLFGIIGLNDVVPEGAQRGHNCPQLIHPAQAVDIYMLVALGQLTGGTGNFPDRQYRGATKRDSHNQHDQQGNTGCRHEITFSFLCCRRCLQHPLLTGKAHFLDTLVQRLSQPGKGIVKGTDAAHTTGKVDLDQDRERIHIELVLIQPLIDFLQLLALFGGGKFSLITLDPVEQAVHRIADCLELTDQIDIGLTGQQAGDPIERTIDRKQPLVDGRQLQTTAQVLLHHLIRIETLGFNRLTAHGGDTSQKRHGDQRRDRELDEKRPVFDPEIINRFLLMARFRSGICRFGRRHGRRHSSIGGGRGNRCRCSRCTITRSRAARFAGFLEYRRDHFMPQSGDAWSEQLVFFRPCARSESHGQAAMHRLVTLFRSHDAPNSAEKLETYKPGYWGKTSQMFNRFL